MSSKLRESDASPSARAVMEKDQAAVAMLRGLRLSKTEGLIRWALSGEILEVNRTYCEMLGYSEDELYGMTYPQLAPSECQAAEQKIIRERLLTGESGELYEKENRRKDGSVFPVEMRTFLARDGRGEPSFLWAIVTNISERKRVEKELIRAKALLEAAFEQTPAGILFFDAAEGRIQMSNRLSEELMGMGSSAQAQIGLEDVGPLQLFHPDGSPMSMDDTPLSQALARGRTVRNFEFQFVRPDGAKFSVLANGAPVRDSQGTIIGGITVFLDITERKEVEARQRELQHQLAQAQKMDSIGRLAGGIAHDVNNVLTVIIGNTSLALLNMVPDDQHYAAFCEIEKAAHSAAQIIRHLLVFSRKQVLEPRVMNLNELIHRMQKMLEVLVGGAVQLTLVPGAGLDPIRADAGQIEQVVVNLVINARDAMPDGGALRLETRNVHLDQDFCEGHESTRPGPYVMLSITDTGSGMAAEVKRRAIEPFFTTKGPAKGTGLGLSIVFGIVTQHGGMMEIDSELGKGTCVRIYFPRIEDVGQPLPAWTKELKLHGGHETVLLVEDEREVRRLAVRLLRRLGYRVIEAESAEEALQAAKVYTHIHLLLSDVVMRGMNGVALAESLRRDRPDLKVLLTSGYLEDIVVPNQSSLHFLDKPYTPHSLAQKVRDVLDS